MSEFNREDRFIVVKLKDLVACSSMDEPHEAEEALRDFLASWHVPTRACVVVESDWPEYELVWKMIQDRVEGKAATPSEDGREVPLAERMKAAGMIPAAELIAGAPLDTFVAHAGVVDLDTFGQWLVMKRKEYIDMQARFTLDKREDDELYEWVVAHCAVFGEVHINFRNARRAQPARQVGDDALIEACAKICEERRSYYEGDDDGPESRRAGACQNCADVIRWRAGELRALLGKDGE